MPLFRKAGDKWGTAMGLIDFVLAANSQSDYAAARTYCEESLAIFRELGDTSRVAVTLGNLAAMALDQGNYQEAEPLLVEALTAQQASGDQFGTAVTQTRPPLAAHPSNADRRAAQSPAATAHRLNIVIATI